LERCLAKIPSFACAISANGIALDEAPTPATAQPVAPTRTRLPWAIAAVAALVALLAVVLALAPHSTLNSR